MSLSIQKRSLLPLAAGLLLCSIAGAQVTTKLLTSGITKPLWAGAPAGDERIFIGLKSGRIRIYANGALQPGLFLDLNGSVSTGSEQGLLGVAFHPNYASNGYVYVDYTNPAGNTVVSRFTVSSDPDVIDPSSEQVLLTQAQPYTNHNGGDLHFGPDGYLYIFFGDGGLANDPGCRAQDLSTWLGKILRIDVDSGSPYAVPADNPFVGVPGALPEIFHLGVRNPWRNGFDRLTGDLYIGDVGQDLREEISVAPAGSKGLNFGWKVQEGNRCNSTSSCTAVPACGDPAYVAPITELFHNQGSFCITGGFVYRGCAIPSEQGHYFYADYVDNKIRSLEYDPQTGTVSNLQDRTAELAPGGGLAIRSIASFGEDGFGELLILDHSGAGAGELYKLVPAGAPQALATERNGSGVNRVCLTSRTLPILGQEWVIDVDSAGHPGASLALVSAYPGPSSGTFIGSSELLLDLSGGKLFTFARASTGVLDTFRIDLPCRLALSGLSASVQGAVLGGPLELCNALDVTLGLY